MSMKITQPVSASINPWDLISPFARGVAIVHQDFGSLSQNLYPLESQSVRLDFGFLVIQRAVYLFQESSFESVGYLDLEKHEIDRESKVFDNCELKIVRSKNWREDDALDFLSHDWISQRLIDIRV